MGVLRAILTIIFIIDCVVLTVLVLSQEGKDAGLGALAGGSSYWEQNKGRSTEGKKIRWTKILAVVFILLAILLNLNF